MLRVVLLGFVFFLLTGFFGARSGFLLLGRVLVVRRSLLRPFGLGLLQTVLGRRDALG